MALLPLVKPSWHARAKTKEAKARDRRRARQAQRFMVRQLSEMNRRAAYERDGGKCRATGRWLPFNHRSLLKVAHSHHVIFKSAGGSDGPENRITICFDIHWMIHDHRLEVTGDPNRTVTFTERNPDTGKVVRSWDSTV